MRLPYINLRWVVGTVLFLLLVGGGVFGWFWWHARPDYLYASALDDFHQGQKAREANDTAKERSAYEHADTQLSRLEAKDPGRSQAWVLHYKVLMPLAGLEGKAGQAEQAQRHQEQAYFAGSKAVALDKNNVEAQAIMLNDRFRNNDFERAYPFARALIDHLPASGDTSGIELENFNVTVVGAYYVLALREMGDNRPNPDQALDYLAASLEWEKKKGPSPTSGPKQSVPRWREVALEVKALQLKAETSRRPGAVRAGAGDPATTLKTQVAHYLERVGAELKDTIPPADGKPEQPLLATLSATNANGLIDFLLVSLATADDRPTVQDRAERLLEVCEKLASANGAPGHIYQEAARGTARLSSLVSEGASLEQVGVSRHLKAHLPLTHRLTKEQMVPVNERILAINNLVMDKTAVDPATYLEMARNAKDDRPRSIDLAKRGLKVAADQKIPPTDRRVVELQLHVAWMLLLDKKSKEADEILAEVSKQRQLTPYVNYLQGLAAVVDGRLEEGAKKLAAAREDVHIKDNLPLLLGLAHAYMGQGDLENALPVLEQLLGVFDKEAKLDRDDRMWLDLWLPNLEQVRMNLFRCHLALALRGTNAQEHYTSAMRYRAKLTFLAEEADAAHVNFHLARARLLDARKLTSEADAARIDATKVLAGLPASSRNDPRLLSAEVNIILGKPETNPGVIAGAVVAPLGAPTDLAVRLGELGRLRAGHGWHWLKAEERIRAAAAAQPNILASQVALVRWLQMNGRTEEALALLAELEGKALTLTPAERQQVQAYHAAAELSAGHLKEAQDLIEGLRHQGQELPVAVLEVLAQLAAGNPKLAQELIGKAVSKHDQSGLLHYWQGRVHQSNGDFAQAIPSYERSLQFAQFKGVSQNGLLACVLGLAAGPPGKPEKANPEAALEEATRLKKSHPEDPAILMAYAVTARAMDRVYGPEGMEGALTKMEEVLRRERPTTPETGPYLAAGQWIAAGRPDKARQELRANLGHIPSLALATRLALADEDWAEVSTNIQALEKLQPDAIDLPLWRAAVHEARGEIEDAKAICKTYVDKYPKLNTGYLTLARLHENAKEYKEALDWVRKWRKEMPEEINGLVVLVRVLARDKQVEEASKEADDFLKEQLKKVRDQQEEWGRNNPIKEKDKDKAKEEAERRAKANAERLLVLELVLTRQVAVAFQEAKAYTEAEKWLTQRALPLIDKLPEAARKDNRLTLQLDRGTLYLGLGKQEKEKSPQRAKFMDLAIAEYEAVWQAVPGHLIAGNNLAWLLVKEKGDAERALAIAEEVRKGKYSRKPVSGERLQLELLDTLGVIYRAAEHNQDALNMFKEAMQRYDREPRVVMHLAQSQAALRLNQEAYTTFNVAINLAAERAKTSSDPERKATMERLIADAKSEQKKIGLAGGQ